MRKATILIVDDELLVRRVLGDALTRVGYKVEQAANGQAALERLSRDGIDLLLLDLFLGDLDGVQVLQEARRLWPLLPIVMLTAHGSMSSAIEAVRHGASDYLLKPVSIETLRSCVERVLEQSANHIKRSEWLRSMYQQMRVFLEQEGILSSDSDLNDLASKSTPSRTPSHIFQAGPLRIDTQQHTVMMHGRPIEVTPSEFLILQELLSQKGAVVPCSQLVKVLHSSIDDEEEARQIIRPHIVRLRRKLEPDTPRPCYLLSIRGVGYRWAFEER
jgi:Response regulators consisting of a CheY-like receiver domain and a winged-helix DNA-binding domain